MDVTLHIPDQVAHLLGPREELGRRALEALALEEFKRGQLSRPDLRLILGLETALQVDAVLAHYGIDGDYDLQDLERDRAVLDRLGV